jgi:hypothetical protein
MKKWLKNHSSLVIGGAYKILTDLFAQDKITGIDSEGTIVYCVSGEGIDLMKTV